MVDIPASNRKIALGTHAAVKDTIADHYSKLLPEDRGGAMVRREEARATTSNSRVLSFALDTLYNMV